MGIFGNLYNPFMQPMGGNQPGMTVDPSRMMQPQTGGASMQAPMQAPAKAKNGGAFAQGGLAWKILGALSEGLSAAGGGQGTYLPAMLDLQKRSDEERKWQAQLAQQAQQYQVERADKREDWQYQQANATPNLQREFEYARQMNPGMTLEGFMRLKQPSQWVPGEYGGGQYARPDAGSEAPDELPANFSFGGGTGNGAGGFRP